MPGDDDRKAGRVRIARPRWSGVIFICGKCLKRHRDGKDLRRAVKSEAKMHETATKSRKVRIVKVACLGLCPKFAVVVASSATLLSGEVILLEDIDSVAAAVPRLLRDRGA